MKPATGSGSSSCGQLDSEPSCCAIWINCTGEATGKDERARAGLHRSHVGEGNALLGRYFVFIYSSFLSVSFYKSCPRRVRTAEEALRLELTEREGREHARAHTHTTGSRWRSRKPRNSANSNRLQQTGESTAVGFQDARQTLCEPRGVFSWNNYPFRPFAWDIILR